MVKKKACAYLHVERAVWYPLPVRFVWNIVVVEEKKFVSRR